MPVLPAVRLPYLGERPCRRAAVCWVSGSDINNRVRRYLSGWCYLYLGRASEPGTGSQCENGRVGWVFEKARLKGGLKKALRTPRNGRIDVEDGCDKKRIIGSRHSGAVRSEILE